MDKNKSNLDKAYWDDLENKCPGYIENFIQWAEKRLEDAKLTCVDHFYCFPLSMQLGLFYEFVSLHACEFTLDVVDFDDCIIEMEDYFHNEREYDLLEKQRLKSGEI